MDGKKKLTREQRRGDHVKIETERLFLREMTNEDFYDLAAILQNPLVMYAYDRQFTDEDVQRWLDRQIMRYLELGFGLWAVVKKDTEEIIGQAGLTMQPHKEGAVLEIGYLFKQEFWHNGYATEAAEACREYAFHELNAKVVYSIIRADNQPSINVAIRNGMTCIETFIPGFAGNNHKYCLYATYRSVPNQQRLSR